MSKSLFSDKAFLYLFAWAILTFVLIEFHQEFLIYGYELLTLFLLGFIGLYLYHYTRRSDEITRWTMILLLSGLVILFLNYVPNLAELYLSSLAARPYFTIGLTAFGLGMFGILVRSIPVFFRLIDALMTRIESRRSEA